MILDADKAVTFVHETGGDIAVVAIAEHPSGGVVLTPVSATTFPSVAACVDEDAVIGVVAKNGAIGIGALIFDAVLGDGLDSRIKVVAEAKGVPVAIEAPLIVAKRTRPTQRATENLYGEVGEVIFILAIGQVD